MKSHTSSNHDYEKQSVAIFDALNDKPIVYHKIYSKITGSTSAGLLLSQLIYWSRTMKYAQFYKTNAELCEELGMKIDEFKLAKKRIINKKLFFTFIKGVPATTYYQINLELLVSLICENGCGIPHLQLVGKPPTRRWENHQQGGGKTTNKEVGKPPTISENTQNITENNNNNREKVNKIAKNRNDDHDKCAVVLVRELNEKIQNPIFENARKKEYTKDTTNIKPQELSQHINLPQAVKTRRDEMNTTNKRSEESISVLMKRLKHLAISKTLVTSWLKKYSLEYIIEKIELTENQKPHNPEGFLNRAITQDWKPALSRQSENRREGSNELIYPSHDENIAWYNLLTDKDKLKHLQMASFKYPMFEAHLKHQQTSVLDATFSDHSLFQMFMSLLGRAK